MAISCCIQDNGFTLQPGWTLQPDGDDRYCTIRIYKGKKADLPGFLALHTRGEPDPTYPGLKLEKNPESVIFEESYAIVTFRYCGLATEIDPEAPGADPPGGGGGTTSGCTITKTFEEVETEIKATDRSPIYRIRYRRLKVCVSYTSTGSVDCPQNSDKADVEEDDYDILSAIPSNIEGAESLPYPIGGDLCVAAGDRSLTKGQDYDVAVKATEFSCTKNANGLYTINECWAPEITKP